MKKQICSICDLPTDKCEDDQILLCGEPVCESCLENEYLIDSFAITRLTDDQWNSNYTMFFLKDKLEYLRNL